MHDHDLKCLKKTVIVPTHFLNLLKSKCRVYSKNVAEIKASSIDSVSSTASAVKVEEKNHVTKESQKR